eukprot:845855-Pyramimonas_sp.AAC.1
MWSFRRASARPWRVWESRANDGDAATSAPRARRWRGPHRRWRAAPTSKVHWRVHGLSVRERCDDPGYWRRRVAAAHQPPRALPEFIPGPGLTNAELEAMTQTRL